MPKKNILEEAVRITMQEEKTIARSDFNTILTKIRQIDLHQPENRVLKDLLAGKHLGLWKNIFERKKVDEEIDDDVDIHRAFLKLVELNKSIEGLKCFVESSYKDVKETFAYLNTEINSRQLATAMAMAANTEYNKYQLWVVPAGQGKSRIAGAAAYHLLKTTDKHVYVVFANDRLMRDDKEELDNIWTFVCSKDK